MDLAKLKELKELKKCVYLASDRCRWWERIFCNQFIKFLRQLKKEKSVQFAELIVCHTDFLNCLKLGQVVHLNSSLLSDLDFSNPGRVMINLAFVSYLLDVWDQMRVFSPDFILESVCFPAWQRINLTLKGVTKETGV